MKTNCLEAQLNTIPELTATTLKLRYTFEDAGVIYREEDTYSH